MGIGKYIYSGALFLFASSLGSMTGDCYNAKHELNRNHPNAAYRNEDVNNKIHSLSVAEIGLGGLALMSAGLGFKELNRRDERDPVR